VITGLSEVSLLVYTRIAHSKQCCNLYGATENAGLENAAPDCRGGKRGSSTVWKAEVSVILHCYKCVATATRTNVNQKDFTHWNIFIV